MKNTLSKLITIGIEPKMSFTQKRNVQITNTVAVILLGITLLFCIPLLWLRDFYAIIENITINIATAIPALLVLYLNKKQFYKIARYLLFVFFSAFLFGLPIITGSYSGTNLHFAVLMASSVLLFEKKWNVLIFFGLSSILFVWSSYLIVLPSNPLNLVLDKASFWINGVSFIVLFYFALTAFKIESHKYQKEIEIKNEELSHKNQQIRESINYAKYIQQAMLPNFEFLQRDFPESFVFYQPKDIVSGDFFWFEKIENDWIIAVADCTGHGVPGALMSMQGMSLLEQIIVEKKITQPDEILSRLDNAMRASRKSQSFVQDGMDIAICKIDSQAQKIYFAGAHHSIFLLQNKQLTEIKGDRKGIGSNASMRNPLFQVHTLDYTTNTKLYFSSDGYKDQFGGTQNRKFSPQQFREMLINFQDLSFEEQGKQITNKLKTWQGNERQTDDITVLGLKINF